MKQNDFDQDLSKKTYKTQMPVEVDGKTSAILVTRVFNPGPGNGTGKITISITTKQISPKKVYKDGVLETVGDMLSEQYDLLLAEMLHNAAEYPNGDPNQIKIGEEPKGQRAKRK